MSQDIDIITPLKEVVRLRENPSSQLANTPAMKKAGMKLALALRAQLKRIVFALNRTLVEEERPGFLRLAGGLSIQQEQNVLSLSLASEGSQMTSIQGLAAQLYSQVTATHRRECGKLLEEYVDLQVKTAALELQADKPTDLPAEDYFKTVFGKMARTVEQEISFGIMMAQSLSHFWWGQKDNVPQLTGFISKKMWELGILNKDVLGLTIKIFGFNARLADYNYCLSRYDVLTEAVTRMPGLAPFLRDMQDNNYFAHIAQVKRTFRKEKMTDEGWRWLGRQSSRVVGALYPLLVAGGYRQGEFPLFNVNSAVVEKINVMAKEQVGRLPLLNKLWFWDWLTSDQKDSYNTGFAIALRQALRAYRKRKATLTEIGLHFGNAKLLVDSLSRMPVKEVRRRLRNATWKSMMARSMVLRQQLVAPSLGRPALEWAPGSGTLSLGGYSAHSINSSYELEQFTQKYPSFAIGYCAQLAAEGRMRIYALSDKCGVVGVLGLSRRSKDAKRWMVGFIHMNDIRYPRGKIGALVKAVKTSCKIPR